MCVCHLAVKGPRSPAADYAEEYDVSYQMGNQALRLYAFRARDGWSTAAIERSMNAWRTAITPVHFELDRNVIYRIKMFEKRGWSMQIGVKNFLFRLAY